MSYGYTSDPNARTNLLLDYPEIQRARQHPGLQTGGSRVPRESKVQLNI